MFAKAHHIDILTEYRINLRSEVLRLLDERKMTRLELSDRINVGRGHIYNFLSNSGSLGLDALDAITQFFGLPFGSLYRYYLGECLLTDNVNGTSKWRVQYQRCVDFMYSCIIHDMREYSDELTAYLMECGSDYLEIIFRLAEKFYENGNWKESIPLYFMIVPYISKSGRFSAKSLSRLLEIMTKQAVALGTKEKLEVVYKLEVFSDSLPEDYELDTYTSLAKFYLNEGRWDKVDYYGEKLWRISELNKGFYLRKSSYNQLNPFGSRPLVFYYGFGWLMKGISAQKTGNYEYSLYCIDQYIDLSDFGLNQVGEVDEIEKLKRWGIGNRFTVQILSGDYSILREYLDYLHEHPEEILAGLVTIFESAHTDDSVLELVLAEFDDKTAIFTTMNNNVEQVWRFSFHLYRAKYFIRRESNWYAVEDLLAALHLAGILRSFEYYISCISLLESLQMDADQKETYRKLLKEVNNA